MAFLSSCRPALLRYYNKAGPVVYESTKAATDSKQSAMNVFDWKTKIQQRNWTASLPNYKVYDYVKDEMGWRTFDRICDVKRKFTLAADVGCGRGHVSKHLTKDQELVDELIMFDNASKILDQAEQPVDIPCQKILVEEEIPPLEVNKFDLIYSSLSLHWVNDLPGCFLKIFQALKEDGVFIGTMLGGDTLFEMRCSLQLAETELLNGFSPRVSPFVQVRDVGSLMSQAGFKLLTIDIDEMTVNYPGIKEVMKDLQGMGESGCSHTRKGNLRRDVIQRANEIYKENYGTSDSVPATFQVMGMIGWKLGPGGPKPAARGSGQVSLKDIGNLDEVVDKFKK